VATMLEKLGFQKLIEETLTVTRIPRFMAVYEFVLAIVLSLYLGFFRLSHICFVAHDPMLTGILKVAKLPPQCTFWRFLASLHLGISRQLLEVQRRMRERVWEAANVGLTSITLDTRHRLNALRRSALLALPSPDGNCVIANRAYQAQSLCLVPIQKSQKRKLQGRSRIELMVIGQAVFLYEVI